ncbi:MAG: DUF4159 domain-containing protein [Candidatus Latescibacter sp.]|nr:DUF4159 domain-containing protein [Candidatus Latescibacter sp.]
MTCKFFFSGIIAAGILCGATDSGLIYALHGEKPSKAQPVVMAARHPGKSKICEITKPFRPGIPKYREFVTKKIFAIKFSLPYPQIIDFGSIPELPDMTISPSISPDPAFPEISMNLENKSVLRKPEKTFSLKEEMLNLSDLNTGQYSAMTAQELSVQGSIRGYLTIHTVWGEQLRMSDRIKRAPLNLAEALNRYTDIVAQAGHHLFLSSPRIFQIPFLYIASDTAFELTETERINLGEYLRNGGFAFVDNASPELEISAAEASLRRMFRDALGAHARFEPIPVSHPLYHCFFDFRDGPPPGGEIKMINTETVGLCGSSAFAQSLPKPVPFLEGVLLDDRLAAVYSDKGYSQKWSSLNFIENQPQLKMGVNAVVYALTQEGGITQHIMEHFTDIP